MYLYEKRREKEIPKKKVITLALVFCLTNAFVAMLNVNLGSANTMNKAWFEVSHGYWIGTEENVVTNVPYPSAHQWLFQIHNGMDETGQPMINPSISVSTDREFVDFSPWPPSISDGEYRWDFPLELPECFLLPTSARELGFIDYRRPGFSAERRVSPEVLADPVTVQYLSFTFTLEDALPPEVTNVGFGIGIPQVIFMSETMVNYTILSLNPVEDWELGATGWNAHPSNVVLGKTYHFEATLEAVKSPKLGGTPTAIPGVMVHYAHWDHLGNIGVGPSATAIHPEGPAMTVSADGEYEWEASISYSRQDFWFHQVVSEVVENPNPPPPYTVKIPATVDIKPETFNLKRKAKWVTGYIELPEGYNVNDINVSSLLLNGVFPAELKPTEIGDYDNDGIPDLMVKFDISTRPSPDSSSPMPSERFITVTLTVTGSLNDETLFEGSDTIKIIFIMPRWWRFLEFY